MSKPHHRWNVILVPSHRRICPTFSVAQCRKIETQLDITHVGIRGCPLDSRVQEVKHSIDLGRGHSRSDASKGSRMKLTFRETLTSDVEGLFSVRAHTSENPISKEQLASLGITAESIARQLASGRMKGWVCLESSTLVGFCSGDAETGEVLVLAVLPDYERNGIGTYLLSRVVEWLRSVGSNTIWLAASPDSRTRAHGFYRSLGWRPNGEIDENDDEILELESSEPLQSAAAGARIPG
jgi:GNAT superfamily N-acetyltransferase